MDVSLSVAGKVHHWKKVMIRANEECMLCEDFVFEQVKTWEMERPDKGCSGVYIWQFCDVRVSDEWFAGRPRTMNNKGVVDEYRRHKLSYDVVKRIFESYSDYLDIMPDP